MRASAIATADWPATGRCVYEPYLSLRELQYERCGLYTYLASELGRGGGPRTEAEGAVPSEAPEHRAWGPAASSPQNIGTKYASDSGIKRIVASETEAPNIFVDLV